jgi:MFS family permease
MSGYPKSTSLLPWWKEPTKDQWYAYIAAWLGWTLDAFDFTVFLVLIVPIAKEFNEPLTWVALVGTLTLWMRLLGAVAAGWMADRMGRRAPLMISILWYSICNFIAGFSPTFLFLLFFRTLLGIGMGAEWPAGAALAMETWPPRSLGLMSSILQGSWELGYLLSALLYATVFQYIGWRGVLWMGVLPAFAVVWIRVYVIEPHRTPGLGAEPEEPERPDENAAVRDIPPWYAVEYLHRLLVDGQRFCGLLSRVRPVRDLPDARPAYVAGGGRLSAGSHQRRDLRRQLPVGRVVGDDHSGDDRLLHHAGLPAHHRLPS